LPKTPLPKEKAKILHLPATPSLRCPSCRRHHRHRHRRALHWIRRPPPHLPPPDTGSGEICPLPAARFVLLRHYMRDLEQGHDHYMRDLGHNCPELRWTEPRAPDLVVIPKYGQPSLSSGTPVSCSRSSGSHQSVVARSSPGQGRGRHPSHPRPRQRSALSLTKDAPTRHRQGCARVPCGEMQDLLGSPTPAANPSCALLFLKITHLLLELPHGCGDSLHLLLLLLPAPVAAARRTYR
jgi:hypothetical protein